MNIFSKTFGIKKISNIAILLIFVFVYFFIRHEDIKKGEAELYNNIPNIEIYKSTISIKDVININGRSPVQILGRSNMIIEDNGALIKKYYQVNLEKNGWKEVNNKKLFDNVNRHIGDKVIFKKGEYIIAIYIFPPVGNNWNELEVSSYINGGKPYYQIYAGNTKSISIN